MAKMARECVCLNVCSLDGKRKCACGLDSKCVWLDEVRHMGQAAGV